MEISKLFHVTQWISSRTRNKLGPEQETNSLEFKAKDFSKHYAPFLDKITWYLKDYHSQWQTSTAIPGYPRVSIIVIDCKTAVN